MKEAILSCSGGLDSTSLLLNLLRNGYNPHIVNFNYGSKQNKLELKGLKKNLNYLKKKGYNIDYQTINISSAMKDLYSSLTRNNLEVAEGKYTRETEEDIFVPNRNAIFASIIFAKALTIYKDTQNDVSICMGIHGGEHDLYPDCTPEFFNSLFESFQKGNFHSEHIHAYNPYVEVNKQKVLEDGLQSCKELNLDYKKIYKNTLSCYKPNEKGLSCGKCPTCLERLEIFENLGLKDPAKYEVNYKWTLQNF